MRRLSKLPSKKFTNNQRSEETGREDGEEINPEKESKSDVVERSESLKQNEESSSIREPDIPAFRGLDSDSSGGACTSNCPYYPQKPPQVFQRWNRDSYALQWKHVIDNIKKKSARSFSIIPLLTNNYEMSKKNLWRKLTKFYGSEAGVVDIDGIPVPKPSWKTFSYSDLCAATDHFSPENMLGKGGNAEVYKGHLTDGQIVAVKKLIKNEKEEEDRANDFLLELGIIAHINHPNAAHLIGFSVDGGLHLVLQFAPHGSLASVLFGSDECLDWKTRYKVATGIAEGLKYLHHDCPRRIIHRDITASNILLTEDYEAHISDFGLAKWLPENWHQHVVHPIEGTFGYLAPEYFMHGIVDEKTDVFAFGVLLLEILTGRRAVDLSRQSLMIWGKPLLESNKVKELVDPRLEDDYDQTQVKRAMLTASMCINHLANLRPSMTRVVELLKNEDGAVESQQKSCGGKAVIVDGCDLQDYSRSSYLDDLNRHMQLVLE
ncbi:receptor-like cytosolic serine/threonine-protein kinase RBK1 [Gossypium australe]|uniref:non-specific serine/threonine protein kinase n=1 Tax=Gossypium australe TaxID=47621 RepID=A0A5B6UUA2_9ROSI|nr:receptor-like cytosolic serine/threonine-protein kinase RBK1 [Gossypium australe]